MNLRQIEVFRAIMLCRSITDAARVLNVSQPTITKILRRAEDQLGITLFRREHGRLRPTEEAELLFPDVDRIFRELQSLRRLSTDLRDGTAGLLRVGATASLALSVVPDALKPYRRDFPGVQIMSHLLAGREMAEMIMAHQLDIGVSVAPIDVPAARVEAIHKAEVICIMPEDHPLAARRVVGPRDIVEYTLISYSGATPSVSCWRALFGPPACAGASMLRFPCRRSPARWSSEGSESRWSMASSRGWPFPGSPIASSDRRPCSR